MCHYKRFNISVWFQRVRQLQVCTLGTEFDFIFLIPTPSCLNAVGVEGYWRPWSHSMKHTHTHTQTIAITRNGPVAETSTWQNTRHRQPCPPVGFEPADSGLRPRGLRDRSGNRGKTKLVFLLPPAKFANALLSYVCIYEHKGKYIVRIYNPKMCFLYPGSWDFA